MSTTAPGVFNLLDLTQGTRVALADGSTAEILDNPQDGIWVICRCPTDPGERGQVGAVGRPVFASDIVSIIEEP
ncbi:MAG: hypothetical protein AB7G13_00385 [Lautropia sp.]